MWVCFPLPRAAMSAGSYLRHCTYELMCLLNADCLPLQQLPVVPCVEQGCALRGTEVLWSCIIGLNVMLQADSGHIQEMHTSVPRAHGIVMLHYAGHWLEGEFTFEGLMPKKARQNSWDSSKDCEALGPARLKGVHFTVRLVAVAFCLMYVNRTGCTNQKCLWYTATQRPFAYVLSNITQVQDVTNVLERTFFRCEFLTPKQGKKFVWVYVSKHLAPTFAGLQSHRFVSVGTLKHFSVFSPIWKWRRFTNACFMSVKPFATASWPFKICDSPWSDVSVRALIGVEDILSVCCELWLNGTIKTQQLLNWELVNVLCEL
jgi:hypothetical protein